MMDGYQRDFCFFAMIYAYRILPNQKWHNSWDVIAQKTVGCWSLVSGNQQVIGSHAKWLSVIGQHRSWGPTTKAHKYYNISASVAYVSFLRGEVQLQINQLQDILWNDARSDFCNRDFREVSISSFSSLPPLRAHFPPRPYLLSPLLRCRPGPSQFCMLGCVIAWMRANSTSFAKTHFILLRATACAG